MTSGLDINDPIVVAAFRSALLHQGIAVLALFVVLLTAWSLARRLAPPTATAPAAEPGWRRLLRVGFGLLWLIDAALQAQPAMPAGLPSQVIAPAAAASPPWVQHLVNWAGTAWSYHPVQAGAATVWIQAGIGLWLLCAPRGALSRLAGLASVGWGLVIWVFGEAFGGVFAPGLSWLTGAPGGVLFYCAAGALIALPARHGRAPWLGRLLLGGMGLFLTGMAVLQAWPGRGSWQGMLHGRSGPTAAMAAAMAATPQPHALSAVAGWFASATRGHGFAVNLAVVCVLAVTGLGLAVGALPGSLADRPADGSHSGDSQVGLPHPDLLRGGLSRSGRMPRATLRLLILRAAVLGLTVAGLAVWVLVQDLGVFGGLGTDPNSMIPLILLVLAGYLARTGHLGAADPVPGPALAAGRLRVPAAGTVLSAGAACVVALGVIPMAAAQASPAASPILARAIDGPAAPLHSPAPGFTLTDQHGQPVSLASLRGKAVLLTFLNPQEGTADSVVAQEFRQAGLLLGAAAGRVEFVAVNVNPLRTGVGYPQAFDQKQRLTGMRDWLFLTGPPARLRAVWRQYGILSRTQPDGTLLGHSWAGFVIAPDGRMREELNLTPGPGTAAARSSFAAELASAIQR
jgi:cytochrome oxidase Cu insertion factor (SCO1/SenC/PrrC family)